MSHEPPDGGGLNQSVNKKNKVSFRDIVLGKKDIPVSRPRVDLLKENLARIEYEDGNPLKPKVHIADYVFEGLYTSWQDALVISLLGKSIGYNTLRDILMRLWKLMVGFEILDIGNNFFHGEI